MKIYEEQRDSWWTLSRKFAVFTTWIFAIGFAFVGIMALYIIDAPFNLLNLEFQLKIVVYTFVFITFLLVFFFSFYFWSIAKIEKTAELNFQGDRDKFEQSKAVIKSMLIEMEKDGQIKVVKGITNFVKYEAPSINFILSISFLEGINPIISFRISNITNENKKDIDSLKAKIIKNMEQLECPINAPPETVTTFIQKPLE
ncbi:hypothetical protein [[Eubacterium] cellulosolvens]